MEGAPYFISGGGVDSNGLDPALIVVSLGKALNEIASTFEWLDW